jgi:DNA-binding MarR family transcriptional regulator
MSTTDEQVAAALPEGRTAPDTHPAELQRLALQERTHPDCDPLLVQAHLWLYRAYSAASNAQAEELRPLGLSPSAFNVLMTLLNTPDNTLEPCQLAERLLVSRPSVTGLLDTLQAKGLIVRRPHEEDGRRVLVELTTAACDLLEAHFPVHYSEQQRVFGDLDHDELTQLVCLLRKVHGAVPSSLELELG